MHHIILQNSTSNSIILHYEILIQYDIALSNIDSLCYILPCFKLIFYFFFANLLHIYPLNSFIQVEMFFFYFTCNIILIFILKIMLPIFNKKNFCIFFFLNITNFKNVLLHYTNSCIVLSRIYNI